MFQYILSNKRRIDCPFCGKRSKYSAYINAKTGELAPEEYGMCSSCRGRKSPPNNYVQGESMLSNYEELAYFEADTLSIKFIDFYHKPKSYMSNTFIEALERRFGETEVKRVVDLYKIGRFEDYYHDSSAVVFPYLLTDSHCCTGKLMWFDDNLHRIKEGKKQYPRFLHNLIYRADNGILYDFNEYDVDDNGNEFIVPFKLKMCLFGHHQIVNDATKTICLVESEKTAVIMSIVFPEFIWVASGGLNLIQSYKFTFFGGRKCFVFPDLDIEDNSYNYWYEKLSQYSRKYGYDFEFLDFYSEFLQNDQGLIKFCKERKFDVADFVVEFNRKSLYTKFLRGKLKSITDSTAINPFLLSEY